VPASSFYASPVPGGPTLRFSFSKKLDTLRAAGAGFGLDAEGHGGTSQGRCLRAHEKRQ
jgi:hypothetical protein